MCLEHRLRRAHRLRGADRSARALLRHARPQSPLLQALERGGPDGPGRSTPASRPPPRRPTSRRAPRRRGSGRRRGVRQQSDDRCDDRGAEADRGRAAGRRGSARRLARHRPARARLRSRRGHRLGGPRLDRAPQGLGAAADRGDARRPVRRLPPLGAHPAQPRGRRHRRQGGRAGVRSALLPLADSSFRRRCRSTASARPRSSACADCGEALASARADEIDAVAAAVVGGT